MAMDPTDVTAGQTVYGTWTRIHPRTGDPQTRVAETAAEAVSMRWHGWVRLDEGDTPTGATIKTAANQPAKAAAAAAPKPARPKPAEPDSPPSP